MELHHIGKITVKVLGLLLLGFLALNGITPTGSAFNYHQVTASNNFDVIYTTDKSESTNWTTDDAVTKFGNMLETIRTRELLFGFHSPWSGTMPVWITAYPGINAYGGVGWMSFDPYFLGHPNTRKLTANEPYAVASHEFFHTIQFGNPVTAHTKNLGTWVIEGQARSLQDKWTTALDAQPEADFASYLGEVKSYLKYPDRSLVDLTYPTALFWTYVMQRFGSDKTEPMAGLDAVKVFWDQANLLDYNYGPVTAFNNMLKALGYPNETFDSVFKDYVVSLAAKDLTGTHVPEKYKYQDEKQATGSYGPVGFNVDEIIGGVSNFAGVELITHYTPKYYRLTPSDIGTPLRIKMRQITQDTLFYDLLVIKNNDLIEEDRVLSVNYSRTITTDCDSVILVVAGLSNFGSDPAKLQYLFTSGVGMDLNIKYPDDMADIAIGDADNPYPFMAQVEVIGQTGLVEGLKASDFYAKFNGTLGTVLSCSYVMGTYFLLLKAPISLTNIAPDLTIGLKGNGWLLAPSDTVHYALELWDYGHYNTDNIVIIENTDETGYYGKLNAEKVLGTFLIDTFEGTGDVGVIKYGQTAFTVCDPVPLQSFRATAKQTVMQLTNNSGSSPSIANALVYAQAEFKAHCDPLNFHNIFLITSGKETGTPKVSEIIPWIKANKTRVSVMVIGPDGQFGDLHYMADQTGGKFMYAIDPGMPYTPPSYNFYMDLADNVNLLVNNAKNFQRAVSRHGSGSGYWIVSENFTISSTNRALISVNYNSTGNLTNYWQLRLPDNSILSPSQAFANKSTYNSTWLGHVVFNIGNATAGKYSLETDTYHEGWANYSLGVSVENPREQGFISLKPSDQASRIPLHLSLIDDTGPILGANASAWVITGRNGRGWNFTLFDDGNHEDGSADDGVYGNIFTRTNETGPLKVRIHAAKFNSTVSFERDIEEDIPVNIAIDSDGDGLPDSWEITYGLDPINATGINGAPGDPDMDNLSNLVEFQLGTNPQLADTDNGGENDGSEVNGARDPCNPLDDLITPPIITVTPGNANASISFTAMGNYTLVELYRSASGPDSGFTSLGIKIANITFNDTGLTNNQTYWYQARGILNSTIISGWSYIVSTTPRTDLIPPWGIILINNGDDFAINTLVNVSIQAADDAVLMRIGLDPKFINCSWEPVVPNKMIQLDAVDEIQYIYIQFQDEQGNIGAFDGYSDYAYDTIQIYQLITISIWAGGFGIAGIAIIVVVHKIRKPSNKIIKSTKSKGKK